METLKEIRDDWEENLIVVAQHRLDQWTHLVVLKNAKGCYFCHRYFTIGDRWEVSVDGKDIDDPDTVIQWCFNPSAVTIADINDKKMEMSGE